VIGRAFLFLGMESLDWFAIGGNVTASLLRNHEAWFARFCSYRIVFMDIIFLAAYERWNNEVQ
jgi:hypothetical protein